MGNKQSSGKEEEKPDPAASADNAEEEVKVKAAQDVESEPPQKEVNINTPSQGHFACS